MTVTAADQDIDWATSNQRFLVAALEVVRLLLAGEDTESAQRSCQETHSAMSAPPALDAISTAFGLSDFERDILLLCAGVELETAVARACAVAHGEPMRTYATFSLAMAALPDAHWSAIVPSGPLRRWHLVELAHSELPTSSPLRIDERVLHALTGVSYLDPRIENLAAPMPAPVALPPTLSAAAGRLASTWSSGGSSRVRMYGRQRADLRAIVSTASAVLGLQPVCLRASDLPGSPEERNLLARLCERETALAGRSWLVDVVDQKDASTSAIDFATRVQAPVVAPTPRRRRAPAPSRTTSTMTPPR